VNLEPSFINCFKEERNLTKFWFDELQERLTGELQHHIVLYITGRTGTFKSSIGQELAMKFNPNFKSTNIVFDNQALLSMAYDSKPTDWFVRDESPFEFGVGSWRIEKQVQILSETLRQRQNSLIFISPTDRPVLTAHYILETLDVSDDNKYVRVGVIDPWTRKYIGFVLVEIHWNNQIWKEYQERKKIFMEQVVKMDFGESNLSQDVERILAEKSLGDCKNRKELVVMVKDIFKATRTGTELDYVVVKVTQTLREKGYTLRTFYEEQHSKKPTPEPVEIPSDINFSEISEKTDEKKE
jgi:hypothetical protein